MLYLTPSRTRQGRLQLCSQSSEARKRAVREARNSEVDASMCAAVAAMLASKRGLGEAGNFAECIAGMALSYTACKDHKRSSCPHIG